MVIPGPKLPVCIFHNKGNPGLLPSPHTEGRPSLLLPARHLANREMRSGRLFWLLLTRKLDPAESHKSPTWACVHRQAWLLPASDLTALITDACSSDSSEIKEGGTQQSPVSGGSHCLVPPSNWPLSELEKIHRHLYGKLS